MAERYGRRVWERGWADAMAAFGPTTRAKAVRVLTPIACGASAILFTEGAWDCHRIGIVAAAIVVGTIAVFLLILLSQLLMAPARLDAERAEQLKEERTAREAAAKATLAKAEERHRQELARLREEVAMSREEHTRVVQQLRDQDAEFKKALVDHTALVAEVLRTSAGTPIRPSESPVGEPLTEQTVATGLLGMNHARAEVERYVSRCLTLLRLFNIRSREAFERFLGDRWTFDNLTIAYREDLGRPQEKRPGLPLVDPIGLCAWGSRIHMAPDAYRVQALDDVRQALRHLRAQGAE